MIEYMIPVYPQRFPNGFECIEFTGHNFDEIQAWCPETKLRLVEPEISQHDFEEFGPPNKFIQIVYPEGTVIKNEMCNVCRPGGYAVKAPGFPVLFMYRMDVHGSYKKVDSLEEIKKLDGYWEKRIAQ